MEGDTVCHVTVPYTETATSHCAGSQYADTEQTHTAHNRTCSLCRCLEGRR